MKLFFKDELKSYLFVIVLGVLAGLSVVIFIKLPDNNLLSFYYWSSSTFGFWMFSTSLIVLFSENRKCAAINAGTYIFLMFLITTAHQSLHIYRGGATQFNSLHKLVANHIGGWLLYSIPPALVCALLGIVLWSGRKGYGMGENTSVNAGSIFIDRNRHSLLLCICLSDKTFFGIERPYLLSGIYHYSLKKGKR